MHYAEFAEDEVSQQLRHQASVADVLNQSQALLNAIKEYETNKWKVIGAKVGKPAKVRKISPSSETKHVSDVVKKACEQYAKEHFQNQLSK